MSEVTPLVAPDAEAPFTEGGRGEARGRCSCMPKWALILVIVLASMAVIAAIVVCIFCFSASKPGAASMPPTAAETMPPTAAETSVDAASTGSDGLLHLWRIPTPGGRFAPVGNAEIYEKRGGNDAGSTFVWNFQVHAAAPEKYGDQGIWFLRCAKVAKNEGGWNLGEADEGRRARCRVFSHDAKQTGRFKVGLTFVTWSQYAAAMASDFNGRRKMWLSTMAKLVEELENTQSTIFTGPKSNGGVRIETNEFKTADTVFEFVLYMSNVPPKVSAAPEDTAYFHPNSDEMPSKKFTQVSMTGRSPTELGEIIQVIPETRWAQKGISKDAARCGDGTPHGCYGNLGAFIRFAPVAFVEDVFATLGEILSKDANLSLATAAGEKVHRGANVFGTHGGGIKWLHIRIGATSVGSARKYWVSPYSR
ncbi:unnamed protein product [Amoebophrya sp. A25]|nr:unnamed protein product [Amoebophrya sp. A25]|eukprot:GSA25T00021233001.1